MFKCDILKTQEFEAILCWREAMLSAENWSSVTNIINSAFSNGQTLRLVDWSLNPVSMLHYNTDFIYFTTHLFRRTMGITLRTKVSLWISMMDKAMLDLITTKAMSCHGKDVKLDCRGSNRADSFYVKIRLTAGCLETTWTRLDSHVDGYKWSDLLFFFKPLWINSQIKESGFEQMWKQILRWRLWFVSQRSVFEQTQARFAPLDWGL